MTRAEARDEQFPCARCEGPVTIGTEVQCDCCGEFQCEACDVAHACLSTVSTCSACDHRFLLKDLTLAPCACDAEWCKACLSTHVCPGVNQ